MLNRLPESQFFTGMAYGLQRRGYTMSPSHDKTSNGELALHLSMEDAACHLLHMAESGELDVDVRFRLGRDLHGMSDGVGRAVYQWTATYMAFYRDHGHIVFNKRQELFNRLLRNNPVPTEVYLMLAGEFVDNYSLPSDERQWIQLRERTRELAKEAR